METDKRWAIVHAWQECQSFRHVAKQLGHSKNTVKHWVHHYQEHGNVENDKRTGRKPALDDDGAKAALTLLLSDKHGTASEVARVIHAQGKSNTLLHKSTIIRHARKAAKNEGKPIRVVRGLPSKDLSNANKAKRLSFALENRGRSWGNVMITDRKKFHFYYPGVQVKPMKWIRKGEKWVAPKVNHAQVVNLYAGITKYGVTKAHIVAGTSHHVSKFNNKKGQPSKNITSAEYEQVVQHTFLPEGNRLFGAVGVSQWVLQQDNDPTHKKATIKVLRAHKGKLSTNACLMENWPPNSPDLSPIENLWGYLQCKVDARGCKTFMEYQQTVLDELKAVPKSMLANLFASLPKRMDDCIKAKGGKTKY